MKRIIFLVGLTLTTMIACAQQGAPTSSSGSDPSGLSPIYSPGKCHFRLMLNGGTVSVHNASSFQSAGYYPPGTENWSVPLLCHAGASQDDIDGLLDAKQVNGKWIWGSTGQPFAPEQHFRAYNFTGKNWKGIAIAYDMTTGDEATRQRLFGFCLMEADGPQILCGGAQLRSLGSPPATSTRSKIMAVLKTIEFVNSNVTPANSTSAAIKH